MAAIAVCDAPLAAKETVQRFDNGPLLSDPGQYFEMSADLLNLPANSPHRLSGTAFVERIAGGRSEHQQFTTTQPLDKLARAYMISVDGWLSASARQQLAINLRKDAGTRELGTALLGSTSIMPDGSQMRLPPGQTISLHHGSILVIGDAILERGESKKLAGDYLASTTGRCPFRDGPIRVVQDHFLLEGHRDDRIVFWGAVGDSRAYFEAVENKFVKITADSRRKKLTAEFPDTISELFHSPIDDVTLTLKGEFFGDCEVVLSPDSHSLEVPTTHAVTTLLRREPPETADYKVDTPGVSLLLLETDRGFGEDGTLEITYGLKAAGFPTGKNFSLWRYRPFEEPAKIIHRLSVNEEGTMIIDEVSPGSRGGWEGHPLETNLPLTLHHYLAGEYWEAGLVSDDESTAAYAKIFLNPIEARQGDCHLHLEQLNSRRTMFAARGQGFQPNMQVVIDSHSGGTVLRSSYEADELGRIYGYTFPATAGEEFGPARVAVMSEKCSLSIEYEWGRRSSN